MTITDHKYPYLRSVLTSNIPDILPAALILFSDHLTPFLPVLKFSPISIVHLLEIYKKMLVFDGYTYFNIQSIKIDT